MTARKSGGFGTLAVHAGQQPDPTTGAVMTPVYYSSTYAQEGPGEHKGFEYSRTHNLTRFALEANLAALEGGAHGLAFASGLAATSTVLQLFDKVYRRHGFDFTYVDPAAGAAAVEAAIRPATRLVWVETPTNPMLKLVDIAAVSLACKQRGVLLAVDNTFMTPFFQQPLALGADIVVHSTT